MTNGCDAGMYCYCSARDVLLSAFILFLLPFPVMQSGCRQAPDSSTVNIISLENIRFVHGFSHDTDFFVGEKEVRLSNENVVRLVSAENNDGSLLYFVEHSDRKGNILWNQSVFRSAYDADVVLRKLPNQKVLIRARSDPERNNIVHLRLDEEKYVSLENKDKKGDIQRRLNEKDPFSPNGRLFIREKDSFFLLYDTAAKNLSTLRLPTIGWQYYCVNDNQCYTNIYIESEHCFTVVEHGDNDKERNRFQFCTPYLYNVVSASRTNILSSRKYPSHTVIVALLRGKLFLDNVEQYETKGECIFIYALSGNGEVMWKRFIEPVQVYSDGGITAHICDDGSITVAVTLRGQSKLIDPDTGVLEVMRGKGLLVFNIDMKGDLAWSDCVGEGMTWPLHLSAVDDNIYLLTLFTFKGWRAGFFDVPGKNIGDIIFKISGKT